VSNRDNKAAAAEFRELVGVDFDEFTRQVPTKLLLALAKFTEPIDLTVLQFADESHLHQQRDRLMRVPRAGCSVRTRRRLSSRERLLV
jgi:hypothetical protein